MSRLLALAEQEIRADNMDRGKRYVRLATRIGTRTNTPMPKNFLYCRRCLSPLVPGRNCRVRTRSNRVVVNCLECGAIRRTPFVREKRERMKCRKVQSGN